MSYEPNYLAYAHRIRNAQGTLREELIHESMNVLSQEEFQKLLDIMLPMKES